MRRTLSLLTIVFLSQLIIAQENADLNEFSPIVFGPSVAHEGDVFELRIVMSNLNCEKIISVNAENKKDIRYENGLAIITFEAGPLFMDLTGDITIKKSTGKEVTIGWHHSVVILGHHAVIKNSKPVLYRGIENKIDAYAVGFTARQLTASGASLTKKNNSYFARPGARNDSVVISIYGIQPSGDKVFIRKQVFMVLDIPVPVITLNGKLNGEKIASNSLMLNVKLDSASPVEADFEIISWELFTNKKNIQGIGRDLITAKESIDKLKSGDHFAIVCEIKRYGQLEKLSGVWFKQ
ncbi:MAG: hypothetical protein ACJA1C_001181 [Crocinitomicaceae bacterium]|jgi:hypothetical protein